MHKCKKYIRGTLPFPALHVNPTMTASAAEEPGHVNKVHPWSSVMSEEFGWHRRLRIAKWTENYNHENNNDITVYAVFQNQ